MARWSSVLAWSLLSFLTIPPATVCADSSVIAAGLAAPVKAEVTPRGNVLVTETGTGVNDGKLSLVADGAVLAILSGLPSAPSAPGDASGPTALQLHGCCVIDLAIGEGDTLRFSTPPSEVPNPVGPSSPIFSSVLQLILDRSVDTLSDGFSLTPTDHEALADGEVVSLHNANGQRAWLRLLADLKDFRPDRSINVRASNPFAMATGRFLRGPYIADAGANSVVELRLTETPRTLLRFAPIANPPGGPPFSDAVPTSIRYIGADQFLVTLLTGVPFRPGAASVQLIDARTRTQSTLISGLTSATDALHVGAGYYVLELTANLNQGLPGRLLYFSTPTSAPSVVAAGLIGPSGMAYSARQHAIYVVENFAGLLRRVDL